MAARLRRECTDHIITLGGSHLRRMLHEHIEYYTNQRPHESLAGNALLPRPIESADGDIVSTPVLGGLHHACRRAA